MTIKTKKSKMKKVISATILAVVATICHLSGLPVPMTIAITATVGVAVLEIFHFPTVIAAAGGVAGLVFYYANHNFEHFAHTLNHEMVGMIALYLLLIGGTLMANYLIPRTNLVPVISRALPSEKFLPIAIYFVGLAVSYLNPVIGVLFMITLIRYEYSKVDPLTILGAVVTANAGAAMSPMSDVGAVLVANGIAMPSTWSFVLPFVALCGVVVSVFGRNTITDASSKFRQKLNLGNTGVFVGIMFATVVGQQITGFVWPGMLLAVVYCLYMYYKVEGFGEKLKSAMIGFSFLPLLVLIWATVREFVPMLFGEFTAPKIYALSPASTCFDNVALCVSVIKESLPWYFAVLGLCIGGSFLPFSSAASAAANEGEKLTVWAWFKAGLLFNLLYTVMWWAYWLMQ